MPSIKCTNCGAVLKTQAEVPVGKKVKCPKCSEAFVVQAEAPPEEPKKAPAPVEDDPGDPFKDMDAEMPPPRKKSKPADEDEEVAEGEAEDDKPKKKGKSRRGGGGDDDAKPQKSNKTLYIILGVVFGVLTCCVCLPIGGVMMFGGAIVQEAQKEVDRQNKMKGIGQPPPPPVIEKKADKADAPVIPAKKDKKVGP